MALESGIASVKFLDPEPPEGYGPDARVEVLDADGCVWASHWGSDVGNGGVLAWRRAGGRPRAYTPPPSPDWDALDQEELNRALAQDGSVLRALAELTFIEINKLRRAAGLTEYTKQQFVNALKQRMRT